MSGAASLAADKVVATVGSVKAIPPYLETEAKALMLKVPMFRHLVLPGSHRKRHLLDVISSGTYKRALDRQELRLPVLQSVRSCRASTKLTPLPVLLHSILSIIVCRGSCLCLRRAVRRVTCAAHPGRHFF